MRIAVELGIPADQAVCTRCKLQDWRKSVCKGGIEREPRNSSGHFVRPAACMAAAREQAALEKLGEAVMASNLGLPGYGQLTPKVEAARNEYRAACANGEGKEG